MKRHLFTLGTAGVVDMAVQFMLPVLLVRLLAPAEFGAYRALWLTVATGVAVLPWAIPQSLYFFLPRAKPGERSPILLQSLLFMAAAGLAATAILGAHRSEDIKTSLPLIPSAAFVALWVFSSLLDVLCNALGMHVLQAGMTLGFALLRLALTLAAAAVTGDIQTIVYAHVVMACLKAMACIGVAVSQAKKDGMRLPSAETIKAQLHYAAPFGASAALYGLRGRLDQWIVINLYSAATFGAYSVANFFTPIQGLVRTAVNGIMLPRINQLHADNHIDDMFGTNQRANIGVTLLLFPALIFVFLHAFLLLKGLFTKDYASAALVVQMYVLVLLIECVEVSSLLMAYRQGTFMFRLDLAMLALSAATGLILARLLGPAGAAMGGVIAAITSQACNYRYLARVSNRPVARLQAWRTLAHITIASVFSGLVSKAAYMAIGAPLNHPIGVIALLGVLHVLTFYACLRWSPLRIIARDLLGERIAKNLGLS
jgi:O-antigen/teichoic acid export membrane protein